MEPLLFICPIISFLLTFLLTPLWIKRAHRVHLDGKDMNKAESKEKIAEAGGVSVVFGIVIGILIYIGIKTFYFNSQANISEILALLTSLLIIAFIGFTDDILGWKIGLNKRSRLIFLVFAAVPLMVLNVGRPELIGLNMGIFYSLVLIPIGIVGASSTFNFLAGYNGLESSQGILIFSALGIFTWLTGNSWLSLICLIIITSLIAFYIFNKYPAKVFPGDVLTYSLGGLIAIVAILGGIEKIAVFLFIPYIIEVILKLRGKLKKESFAKVNQDGSLEMPYEKIYGLEHLAIMILKKIKPSKKVYEYEVVWAVNAFQLIIIALAFVLFYFGLI